MKPLYHPIEEFIKTCAVCRRNSYHLSLGFDLFHSPLKVIDIEIGVVQQICFVDQNDPQWIGKSPDISDTIIFHMIRNLHVAGRCVECGACARACPEGIDLLMMNKKIAKELKERFDYTVGIDINEKPAMQSYCENEKQDFIMG